MGNANAALYTRKAKYAGRLYSDDEDLLTEQIQGHLNEAIKNISSSVLPEDRPDDEIRVDDQSQVVERTVRALIVPHSLMADQSGSVAAYAYKHLNPITLSKIRTILILHPHHCNVQFAPGRCLLSNAGMLETPLGNLMVDDELRNEILGLSPERFYLMNQDIDEQEHSGEIQYPYLVHCLKLAHRLNDIAVLPVMVGNLKTMDEIAIGTLLRPVIGRPDVLTILSTDFCHWGSLYKYQPWDKSLPINDFIAKLDHHGMELIRLQEPGAFAAYLLETNNTICGRHALAVWLRAVWSPGGRTGGTNSDLSIQFVKYAQSKICWSPADSSVSYAAAVVTLRDKDD